MPLAQVDTASNAFVHSWRKLIRVSVLLSVNYLQKNFSFNFVLHKSRFIRLMKLRKIWILILFLSLVIRLVAQDTNFILPLDKIRLVSSFGELRPDHFHSGMDLSGFHHIGMPVYAADSGYVSRIKVSADGYGNALYITHSNGLKTVYGHLDHFIPEIQQYVEQRQYRQQTFEITLYPMPGELPVRKGQIIGYVGNTGRSYAPHLHFEIRNAYLDFPYNPLKFLPQINDHIPPRILRYAVYPATDTSLVSGRRRPVILSAGSRPVITTYGGIYFGVEVYDYADNSNGRMQPYIIRLFVDDSLWLEYRFDRFFFQNTRYVNTLMDYRQYVKHKFKIQRSYISPNNRLCLYTLRHGSGIFNPLPGRHKITYEAIDFYVNKTRLTFYIYARDKVASLPDPYKGTVVQWNEDFRLDTTDFSLLIPAGSLYDTLHFHFAIKLNYLTDLSPVYQVQDIYTPLQQPIVLRIKPRDTALIDRQVIVRLDKKGKPEALRTTRQGGWLIARSLDFGKFLVMLDTSAPQVRMLTSTRINSTDKVVFKISDNLSGIKDYEVYVNGGWTLFRYDAKTRRLWAPATEKNFRKGENNITVYLYDNSGNMTQEKFLVRIVER